MSFDVSKFKPDNAKAVAIILVVVVVLVIAFVWINKTFGGISNAFASIGEKLGITDSPQVAANKAAIDQATADSANPASPWSPAFYQNAPAGALLLTSAAAKALSDQIWGNWLTNSIDDAVGAIKQCRTKSQVSFLAEAFQQDHNKDLWTWLHDQYTHLISAPEPGLATIANYVNNLPNYNA